ncbi:MAG: integration host factor subunit alpha, partial [Alphaproteobacteria bacterium]|nr:integration host factor subunit alpha [Alphaproteobacteria bacterium]
MSGETITRAHLTEAIHNQVGLSRADSAQLVESVLDEMSKTLETG